MDTNKISIAASSANIIKFAEAHGYVRSQRALRCEQDPEPGVVDKCAATLNEAYDFLMNKGLLSDT